MNKKTKIIVGIIVVIVVVAGIWYGVERKPKEEGMIKIGASLPLTGAIAEFGEWEVRGMQLAIEEINADERFGIKFKLITEDDKALPGEAQKTLVKLLNMDNVDYVIAGTTAIAPVAASIVTDKIIFTPAFMPESVEASKNIFSVMPSLEREMKILADYIYNTGVKTISILYVNNDLGITCNDKFQKAFQDMDLSSSILEVETFGLLDTDYRTQLTKVKNARSEGLVIIVSGGRLGNLIKQAAELGLTAKYFGQTITESPVFISVAENLAEGIIYTYPFKLDMIEKSFLDKYKSKYNEDPEVYSTGSYDMIYVIAELVKKCGKNCNPDDVMEINFAGAGGEVKFDKDRNSASPIYLKTVKDGKFIFIEQ